MENIFSFLILTFKYILHIYFSLKEKNTTVLTPVQMVIISKSSKLARVGEDMEERKLVN